MNLSETVKKFDRRTHELTRGVLVCREGCGARAEFDYIRRRRDSGTSIAFSAAARKLGWARRIRESWTCPTCWEKKKNLTQEHP